MPLFHVGGALTQTLATLSSGSFVVVLSPAGWRNPAALKNLWLLVERYRPETVSSVPTVLAASLTVPVGNADVSLMRYAAGGGSANLSGTLNGSGSTLQLVYEQAAI